jgi:hypothetical protein
MAASPLMDIYWGIIPLNDASRQVHFANFAFSYQKNLAIARLVVIVRFFEVSNKGNEQFFGAEVRRNGII